MRVVIVGSGGHGQVVADVLLAMREVGQEIEPVGFVDDDRALHGSSPLGLPVLGPVSDLDGHPHDAVIIAVGDNRTRQQLARRLEGKGERLVTARHPDSVVGREVDVGAGTLLCAGVVVNPGARIGANVILNTGCSVDHHNVVADFVHIAPGAHLGGDVSIGEGTLVGIGATVMPQRRVGAWCVVGAGAVVCADVPDGVVVVGVPARITVPVGQREVHQAEAASYGL